VAWSSAPRTILGIGPPQVTVGWAAPGTGAG
jgi:hypothetical protein